MHVNEETEGNDCAWFGTAKIANRENMPSLHILPGAANGIRMQFRAAPIVTGFVHWHIQQNN